MSTEIATQQKQELISFNQQQIDLIRKTVAHQLNPMEFEMLMSIASRRGLDPLLNQIHAVPRGQGANRKLTMQVGIDGLRLIAARTGDYAGSDEPKFTFKDNSKLPESASVTVWRFVHNQRVPFTSTAHWDEFAPDLNSGQGFMWKKMPKTMLAKVAEAQALRKGFPGDLSGLYEATEMDQADTPRDFHKPQASEISKGISKKLTPRVEINELPKHTEKEESHIVYTEAEIVPPPEQEYQAFEDSVSKSKPREHNHSHPAAQTKFARGKYAGSTFSSIPLDELEGYAAFMQDYIRKQGEKVPNEWIEQLTTLTDYIGACN